MYEPFEKQSDWDAHDTALTLVKMERDRQIREHGFTPEHDDQHPDEELAAAASFMLVPAAYNPDVCVTDGNGGLNLMPLTDLLSQAAWAELERDDTEHYLSDSEAFERRVKAVTVGTALALAELERLLRLRAKMTGGAA